MLGSGMKIRSIRGDMEMEKKEPKIKIYVSCHKESYIPENKLLYPIQVGTAIAEKKLEGMLYDNEIDIKTILEVHLGVLNNQKEVLNKRIGVIEGELLQIT